MPRKTLACIAAGLLAMVTAKPTPAAVPAPANTNVAFNQIAWFGPYASEKVAFDAGERIINGLHAGFGVVREPIDPEGRGRGPGIYIWVNYHQ